MTALEWAPLVPADALKSFEENARTALGLQAFQAWEPGPTGGRAPVGKRAAYFPVLFVEPPADQVLGLDVAFEETRRAAIDAAIRQGTGSASGRIKLAEDPEGVFSVFVAMPVFRQGLPLSTAEDRTHAVRGLCAVLFRLEPVLRAALRDEDLRGYGITLRDVSADGDEQLLFANRPFAANDELLTSEQQIRFHDRSWIVRVWVPLATLPKSSLPVAFLASGLLLTAVLTVGWALRSALLKAARAENAAQKLGKYRLLRKIASGGMGTVYEAEHALLRRTTAVKVVDSTDASMIARFEREVQAMSALRHPNTVSVYDYGQSEAGTFFYAMEHIHGLDLERTVTELGALPQARVVHILEQVCASLSEAHERGLVHRDIKPGNVMITHTGVTFDFVKVLDFGLVKNLRKDEVKLSTTGEPLGTAQYMAPEAITEPERAATSVDVYAIGALAFFLATGEDAFSGSSQSEIFARHIAMPVPLVSSRTQNEIDPAFEKLVQRCMEKRPAARYASVIELRKALLALPIRRWTEAEARSWWDELGNDLLSATQSARSEAASLPTLRRNLANFKTG